MKRGSPSAFIISCHDRIGLYYFKFDDDVA